MVNAWYMNDNDSEDQRSERHLNPPKYVTLDELKRNSGVLYYSINADDYESEGKLAQIRAERGYTYSDQLECCPQRLDNYFEKLKSFFTEHLHSDEEIRFVLNGSGYFDVRDVNDKWIRVLVEKGDLLILPAGIYHRFTLDHKDYIKVIRLFVGEPVWTPINRPADAHPARLGYVDKVQKGFNE